MSDKHAAPYQILYLTAFIVVTLFTGVAQGQTYKTLYSFSGGSDGAEPMSSLVQDTAGNLYGTTRDGGTLGLGTVFQLAQSGTEKVLHSFTGGTDGSIPASGLILDSAGNLYGTTDLGGAYNHGVVFKIDSSSNESVLHAFSGGTDGIGSPAALIRDGAGNLFGVTYYGGNGPCSFQGNTGCGTIFKIDASGNESVLYNFTGINGDGHPDTALVEDSAGNLYGAARDGEVFEVAPSGIGKPLHILGGADGSDLRGDLIRDGAGNLYGTAFFGGALGSGVVFKVDVSGNETVLYNFSGGTDGANPQSGLVADAAGNFYGTTHNGGAHGYGVVFKLDSAGNQSVLYSFAGGTDGANPYGGLLLDATGNLYGTTYAGGVSGHGTVFEITSAITPPGQGFDYPTFASVVGLALNGNAAQGSPIGPETAQVLRLTAGLGQTSSVWYGTPVPVSSGFTVTFDFNINNCVVTCADGFAFVIQNSKNGTTSLGGGGGYIGYGYETEISKAGIDNSLAIEFDTYDDPTWDPNANHVAVQSCGIQQNSAKHYECNLSLNSNLPMTLADSANHSVSITYVAGTLTTSLDGNVVMTTSVNLSSLLTLNGGDAYIGFTAASGSGGENADVLNWSFSSNSGIVPPGNLSATVGNQSVSLWWGLHDPLPLGFNVYADQIVNGIPRSLGLVNSSGPVQASAYTVYELPGMMGPPVNGQLYRFSVTSVYPQGESAPSFILAQPNGFVAPPHPSHPILFLHGIDADESAWQSTAYFLNHTLGWTCGGTLSYGPDDDPSKKDPNTTALPQTCSPFYPSGDFFTVNFGDKLANYLDQPTDQRGILHQGYEVEGFMRFLQEQRKSSEKVSVVAWSMGGLAARAYMQITDPLSAPGHISDLITLGTPHFGVDTTSLDTAALEALTVGGPLVDSIVLSLFPDKAEALFSRGLQDMNGACVANGDSKDLGVLSPFLQSLDNSPQYGLPSGPRYVVVSGSGYPGYIGIFPVYVFDPCLVLPEIAPETDLVVPRASPTLSKILPASQWSALTRPDSHVVLPSDFPAILCSLDPHCLLYEVHSPVDVQVTAPNGNAISNGFTSMPGANYSSVTDPTGHEIASVLIPFPQGGRYTITATPKAGAQPTDTFTILQIQGGVTTTIAQDMPIQNIPPAGFQTVVKNGTSTVNYSPESIDFGNVVLNRNAKKVLTLQNGGSTKASVGPVSVTVTSGNPDDFSVRPFCNGGVVGPGKQCTIAVHFIPHAVGMETATISIVTDASTVPLEVQLSGTGIKK